MNLCCCSLSVSGCKANQGIAANATDLIPCKPPAFSLFPSAAAGGSLLVASVRNSALHSANSALTTIPPYSTDFSDSTMLTFLRRKYIIKSTSSAKISVSTNAAAKHHSGSVCPNITESVCAT